MAQNWKPTRVTASIYVFTCAVGMFAAGMASLAGSKASALRLGLLGLATVSSLGLCLLALWNLKSNRIADWWLRSTSGKNRNALITFTALIFVASWIVTWTPLERFGSAYYYVQGIYPFIVWLTCFSAAAILLLFAQTGLDFKRIKEYFQDQRMVLIISTGALILFGLLAWLASTHVVGMRPDEEDFWYGAGVPILAFQVQLALLIGIGLVFLIDKWITKISISSRRIDIVLFILIWAVSAWMWAAEPVRSDFLVTAPVAPNFEMYPDYDARNYDIMSQFALIGRGLNNHSFFDRMLYPAFLVYLHNLAGQDYQHLMSIQAALFAVSPALVYLIGKKVHSRSAGLVLGILTALRGVNQIQVGNIIETAHQKYMLTEYPMTVMLILATALLVKWAWNPSKNWMSAGFAGSIIGLSTLLRPHSLALIPTVIALAILVYRQKTRLWIGVSGLVLAAALAGVLPWVQFSGNQTSLFDLYFIRISTIIKQRYPQLFQPSGMQLEPAAAASQGNLHLAQIRPTPAPEKSVQAFALDNFLNNLVTSAQILPGTPFYLEPRVVVKKTDNFWKPYWDGRMTPWARLLLPLNLLFVAVGLGAAWKRARLSGLIPLIVMLVYYAVNALGRTSGGRYLVPVDWVIVIYYVLGLVTIVEIVLAFFGRFSQQPENRNEAIDAKYPSWWAGALTVLVASVAFGSLLPLAQEINPQRYTVHSDAELAEQFVALGGKELGISSENVQKFLASPGATILQGRSLFPRQFDKDEGLDISIYSFYHPMAYPRTLFTLLGPKGENVIILPRIEPAKIPNSIDVMALGCDAGGYIQAWAVLQMDDQSVFERAPAGTPLTCPLPEPVCDNNNSCH